MFPWSVAIALRLLKRARPGRERVAAAALERLAFILALLIIVMALGTLAQMLISHLDPFEAFYFTLITIGGIGYGEPEGLTTAGRIFNVVLICGGLALIAGATATLVSLMLELDLDPRRAHMELVMERLKDHYIVCGAGDVGRHVIDSMRLQQVPFIVLEEDPEIVEELKQNGIHCLHGDATQDAVLLRARVREAKGLVTAVGDHAINAFIVLTAKSLNPALYVVARADHERDEIKMAKVGADKVIFPTKIGSLALANALTRPTLTSFFERAMTLEEVQMHLEEIAIQDSSPLIGETLSSLQLQKRFEATALAVRRADDTLTYTPPGDTQILPGDRWIVIGRLIHLEALLNMARTDHPAGPTTQVADL